MAYDEKFCDSPMKPIADPPKGYGPTSKGVQNGEEGYPKRTSSANAASERTKEGLPEKKISSVDTPIEKISNYGTD